MIDPTVTVVVPTMFRHADLERCLTALATMTTTPDRVLVVTRAEDIRSREIAAAHAADSVVVPRPGLAVAIETGLRAATTELAAFIDDDARAHTDWLERAVRHFAADPALGFVAGRDNVHGDADSGSEDLVVGSLRRGKLRGNHHLGKGRARPALHAKGANMALRVAAVRDLPLGRMVRGQGAQHGNELFLCFGALSRGYHGVYDPDVQVDHHPAARADNDGRLEFSPERLDADVRNSAAAIGLYLGLSHWGLYLLRAVLVGDRNRPGLVWAAVHLLRRDPAGGRLAQVLRASMRAPGDLRRLRGLTGPRPARAAAAGTP
ncbi:glycosyltransferase family 2 protein [Nocardioides sp. CPCC 205120]|uniref:glycosyltransferase family 2 protein n=1 Tax=Nocardioides sp. CPCC 205120 TaxID=3406462 RepID=UPI003B50FD51